ncbi:hypothetical protein KR018_007134, partial [Drosophila ironensis]
PAEPYPPVTEEETGQHIFNAKSPGDDGINAAALKVLPPSSIKLITVIFNKCLDLGYFPTPWKRSRAVMIPKPGKPDSKLASYQVHPEPYRPISLLSSLSKLCEILIANRITDIMTQSNILPDHQFGFRGGHGTVEQ